jgi:hypothetical protein
MVDADRNQARGGKTVYGACVGILMLYTRFVKTWPSRARRACGFPRRQQKLDPPRFC